MTLTMFAQRIAVMEFQAGAGVTQNDVDGISSTFITYFHPSGYTIVERIQINRVIEEQGFQKSQLTESQMVRIGQILNVSKIVVGSVNIVMGQYNVDVRVLNVESGIQVASDGAEFTNFRAGMQSIAQKLASKIAIGPKETISSSAIRTTPYEIYGYLHVFPNDIGNFEVEPSSVISKINSAIQYGYNTWRIPTKEELSLMVANQIIGGVEDYMASDGKSNGKVRLVTDKETAVVLAQQKEKAERAAAEKKAAEEAKKRDLYNATHRDGYVDLGYGNWWKENDEPGYYSYDEAMQKYGSQLPSQEQWRYLIHGCTWKQFGNGYIIEGSNGNYIYLLGNGFRDCDGLLTKAEHGYWSCTYNSNGKIWAYTWGKDNPRGLVSINKCHKLSVRLVK